MQYMVMKPGEKVRLIESSQDLLMERPWPRLILTLRQFGFEPYERESDWNGHVESDDEYVLHVLSNGPEAQLAELLTFLRGEDAEPVNRATDQPWGDLPLRVFLSHVHDQRHLVGEVKAVLAERYGIDAFVAHDDIHPSKKWREVIKAGLDSCDMFVAFLHEGFHASQWCDQEAGWALGRGIPIMTVRPDGVDRRDGFLEEHQDVSLAKATGLPAWYVARQIFTAALNNRDTKDAGVKCLVEAFVGSWSFDTTRYFWSLIETVPQLEPEQLRRLEYAVRVNNQVYDANVNGEMVPDLVSALVEKFEPPNPWGSDPADEPPF